MAECGELSAISGETLEKAIRELGEDPDKRADAVEQLRAKISEARGGPEYEGVEFSRQDGRFLLRARKFDTNRAAQLYCNYFFFFFFFFSGCKNLMIAVQL